MWRSSVLGGLARAVWGGLRLINQARLNALIARGLGEAASRLGASYQQFRPTTPINPLLAAPIGTLQAVIDPNPALTLVESDDRRDVEGTLIGNFSALQSGDYLVGSNTYFVSHLEPLRPATCILCNHTLSVLEAPGTGAAGINPYGGVPLSEDVVVASGWPASILAKSHSEGDPARLPSDVKTAYVQVLLPASIGVVFTFGLRLQDELKQNYIVSSADATAGGWRLVAVLQTT